MSPIDVDLEVYDAASKVFGQAITNHLTHAFTHLQRALGSTGAMAGTDPGGTQWAASYDHAATATFDAMTEANDACFTLAAMLEMTGFNHGMAEDHSNPSGRASTPPDTTTYTAPGEFVCYARPPSAAGGSGSPPHGWGLIQHLVGCMWPNGHQNKLHTAAHAWSSAARTLDTAARFVPEAVHAVRSQRSPEVDDAVTACQAMAQHIQEISSSCHSLATACSDFAHDIDKAHHDVEQELVELLEWTAAIETGGALLATVSFGAGEIPTQAAETGRITATATRVRSIITRLTRMASTSETASNVLTKLAPVEQRLKIIRNVRLSRATTEQVKPLSAITKDTEITATEGLKVASRLPRGVKPGWTSRTANNGKGTVYQEPGATGNANSIRIMGPTSRYANGYVRFYNERGQPIGLDGKPGPNSATHIPRAPDGTYPTPQGW